MTDSRACQRLEIDRCRTTRWSGPSLGAPRIRELIGRAPLSSGALDGPVSLNRRVAAMGGTHLSRATAHI